MLTDSKYIVLSVRRTRTREAFRLGLIEDGEVWMAMIASRNKSNHTYDRSTAEDLAQDILGSYVREFHSLERRLTGLRDRPEDA